MRRTRPQHAAENGMNQKEIKELIDFLIEKDIAEFELERGDVKVRIKRAQREALQVAFPAAAPLAAVQPVPFAPPVAPQPAVTAEPSPAEDASLHLVKSPIVGTYFESPAPGSPPFVKPGDRVKVGQVLCIVEAMKLMNEIEADVDGELVKILVTNGQPVEYGQALFAVRK